MSRFEQARKSRPPSQPSTTNGRRTITTKLPFVRIPPPPRSVTVTEIFNCEPVRLSLCSGERRADPEALLSRYKNSCSNSLLTESSETDDERLKNCARVLADNDIIVICGNHGVGKSTLIPWFSAVAASLCRADPTVPETSAKRSSKFIVILSAATTQETLKKHLRQVYGSKLNVVCYFDISGSSVEHQEMNYQDRADNKNTELHSMKDIDGAIVDEYTGLMMITRGFTGTVFVENGECFHLNSAFAAILGRACSVMLSDESSPSSTLREPRRLGRLVVLTTDQCHEPIPSSIANIAYGSELRADIVTIGNPFMDTSRHYLSTTFGDPTKHFDLANLGFMEDDIMDKVLRLENVPWDLREKGAIADMAKMEGEKESPNRAVNRQQAELICAEIMDLVTGIAKIHESTPSTSKDIGSILVICSGVEQVSAIGNALRTYDGFHADPSMKTEGGTECFRTIRMSFPWRCEMGLIRSTADFTSGSIGAVINPHNWTGAPKVVGSEGRLTTRVFKGKIVLATASTGSLLELKDLMATVMVCSRETPTTYKSNGLQGWEFEFVDGCSIVQIQSRLNRGRLDHRAKFYFAGTCNLAADVMNTPDTRMEQFFRSMTLSDFLREHADPAAASRIRSSTFHAAHTRLTFTEDARILGYIRDADDGGIVLTDEFTRLLEMFPRVELSVSAFIVQGVQMGIANHVICFGGILAAADRLYQQASISGDPGGAVPAFEDPLVSIFERAVRKMSHSSRGYVYHPGYESEAVALADLWASFMRATGFKATTGEKVYQKYVDQSLFANVSSFNFWCFIAWASANDKSSLKPGEPADFRFLFKKFVKDEGRQVFEQFCRDTCRVLFAAGITDEPDPMNSPKYNRYQMSDESPLLSKDGRDLFSGLLTMNSSNFGEYKKPYHLKQKNTNSKSLVLPPRYFVKDPSRNHMHDGEAVVHGYSTRTPEYGRLIAAYTRSYSTPDPDRYQAIVHPVSLGQIAVFANANGKYNQFDPYYTKKEHYVMEILLTGSPDVDKKISMEMDQRVAKHMQFARRYLKSFLNQCLAIHPNRHQVGQEMVEMATFIIQEWRLFPK